MRKIIVSMNVSVDGFMAALGGELDWHFDNWTNEMAESLCEQLSKADTILMGSHTYSAMAAYWPYCDMDYNYPREDMAFAGMMNSYSKIVFSKKLKKLYWNNASIIKNNTGAEVLKLKQQPGKDMIIFGSGTLVTNLMALGLIDEYILWVHPVILSSGRALFSTPHNINMQLIRIKKFRSGVIALYYSIVNNGLNTRQ